MRTTSLTADLLTVGYCGPKWNAFIKFDRQFDMSLIAGPARFHHSEEGLRQDFGRDVLGLAVCLDQCGEPEVSRRTDRGHNGRAFGHQCATRRQADARCGANSKCDNREEACPAQDLRIDCSDLAVELSVPVRGDADVRQHTIVELLEFANSTAQASLSG